MGDFAEDQGVIEHPTEEQICAGFSKCPKGDEMPMTDTFFNRTMRWLKDCIDFDLNFVDCLGAAQPNESQLVARKFGEANTSADFYIVMPTVDDTVITPGNSVLTLKYDMDVVNTCECPARPHIAVNLQRALFVHSGLEQAPVDGTTQVNNYGLVVRTTFDGKLKTTRKNDSWVGAENSTAFTISADHTITGSIIDVGASLPLSVEVHASLSPMSDGEISRAASVFENINLDVNWVKNN